jgi:hypothetical protein
VFIFYICKSEVAHQENKWEWEEEEEEKEHTHKRNVKVNVGKCSNLTKIKLKKQIIFLKSQV